MRGKHGLLIILAGFLILPSLTWSQGPGGRGPGGGRGFGDPDAMFNMFSGGKDVIVVSELDSRRQSFFQRMGITGDRVTKEQFKEAQAKMSAMFTKGGSSQSAPITGAPTITTGTPTVTVQMGSSSRGPSGPPPMSADDLNRRAEDRFNKYDKNKDGLLDSSELAESQSDDLLRERETWDSNRDGFIDLNEYKSYYAARAAQRAAARAEQDAGRSDPLDQDHPAVVPEDGRPVVFRAGRLPKDLPEWFVRLDKLGDNDGQVGLDEWVKGKQGALEEFQKMDLNSDGLLTAEEYLRWKGLEAKKHGGDQQVASRSRGQGQGGPPAQSAASAPVAFQIPGGGPPSGFQTPGGTPGGFQMPGGGPGGFQRGPGSGGPGGFQRGPGSGGPGGFQRGSGSGSDQGASSGGPPGWSKKNRDNSGSSDQGSGSSGFRSKKNRDNGN